MTSKFTELLKEAKEEDRAKELAQLLNSDEWYNGYPILLRGSERKVETWTIKEPYDSRDPMTTSKKIHWFVELFREKYYSGYPSRNKSRFASTQKSLAENYGDVYYIFPSKDAIVGSLPDDAYLGYLGPAEKDLTKFYNKMGDLQKDGFDLDEFKVDVPDEVVDFCKVMMEVKLNQSKRVLEEVKRMLNNFEVSDIGELANKIDNDRFYIGRNGSIDIEESMSFSTALRGLIDFLNHISDYFRLMKVGDIETRSLEVVIQGKLIQVNREFVESYFEKTERGLVLNNDK